MLSSPYHKKGEQACEHNSQKMFFRVAKQAMYRTIETEQPNSSKDDEPAVARRRRVLLSLSWYSSVPFGRAHAAAWGRGSPYVIQSFSTTGRGRSKLMFEGLVSLKETNGRPSVRLARCQRQRFRTQGQACGDAPATRKKRQWSTSKHLV